MRVAVLVCLLVVLAGCSGAAPPPAADPLPSSPATVETATGSPTPTPTGTPARTPTGGPTPTDAPSPTAPAGPTVTSDSPADNPWGADPVTVAVVAPENSSRAFRPLVARALRFWENESTAYEFDYRIVDGGDADVTVRFVATIVECGRERDGRTAGCASMTRRSGTAVETLVRVETGYTDESTLGVLKHEFGHTLGYGHDDTDEYEFMGAERTLTRLPMPNATSLDNPWLDDSLLVSVDYPDVASTQRAEYEAAVERALSFYRTDERSTLPPGVRLETTTNRSAADITVDISTGGSFRSVGNVRGYDNDADAALERYARYEIELNEVDRDRVAWHVGYWLGWAFGAASHDDLPAPFDEPEEDDREEW